MIFFFSLPVIQGDVSFFQFSIRITGFVLMICILIWVNKFIIEKIKNRIKIKIKDKKFLLFLAIVLCNLVSLLLVLGGLIILASYTDKEIDESGMGIIIFSVIALIYQGYSEVYKSEIKVSK